MLCCVLLHRNVLCHDGSSALQLYFLKDAGMFEVVKVEPIGFCPCDLQWWEMCARPLRTEAAALAGEKPAAGEGLVSRDVLFLGQLASRMPRRAEI